MVRRLSAFEEKPLAHRRLRGDTARHCEHLFVLMGQSRNNVPYIFVYDHSKLLSNQESVIGKERRIRTQLEEQSVSMSQSTSVFSATVSLFLGVLVGCTFLLFVDCSNRQLKNRTELYCSRPKTSHAALFLPKPTPSASSSSFLYLGFASKLAWCRQFFFRHFLSPVDDG